MKYPALFGPAQFGPLKVRNRLISAPHGTCQAVDNLVSDAHQAYYATKARGGVGTIITESMRVHPTGLPYAGAVALYDDRNSDRLAALTEEVKRHGAAFIVQLNHAGRAMKGSYSGYPTWSASALPSPLHGEIPHAMDKADIAEMRSAFRDCAHRGANAGFDGVEVHAAHGYLIHQFLSPWSNKRDDEYGGGNANRRRFLFEILEEVRETVPANRLLGVRLSADEWIEGGLHTDDMEEIAEEIASRRLVDYIHVSNSTYHPDSYWTMIPDMHEGVAPFADRIGRIKAAVSNHPVNVVGVGRIHDPKIANDLIETGTLDFVAMARQLIADPAWPRKVQEGREVEVRPCIACNQGCIGMVAQHQPIRCLVNPTAGRERIWDPEDFVQQTRRKVVIVGGGVAGLEAARVAAKSGHEVVLFEQSSSLGGQASVAARAPGRGQFKRLVDYLEGEVRRAGVCVKLGARAKFDTIADEKPDAVIVAAGAQQQVPSRLHGTIVLNTVEAITMAVDRPAEANGKTVVLIDDIGHFQSYGTAEALADAGAKVYLVTRHPTLGAGVPKVSLHRMLKRLREGGVYSFTSSRLVDGATGPEVRDQVSGAMTPLPAVDMIVVSDAPVPENGLVAAIRGIAPVMSVVGDCSSPRTALEAMVDAHRSARELALS